MFDASLRQRTAWTLGTTVAVLLLGALSSDANAGERVVAKTSTTVRHNRTKTAVEATSLKIGQNGLATLAVDTTPGTVAGGFVPPPGDVVYNNQTDPETGIYLPNRDVAGVCTASAVQWMADDLTPASGPCGVSGYALLVAGLGQCESSTFDVHVELWDGDPCELGSALILDTQGDFTAVPNSGRVFLLSLTLAPSIDVPATFWMRAEFSTNDSGWIIAQNTDEPGNSGIPPNLADLGSTQDFWAENDTNEGCGTFFFGGDDPSFAGFWATIWCELDEPPTGACCNTTACSVLNEVDCNAGGGTWQGAFSDCDPNLCQPGACCTGTDFQECSDKNEATCLDGIFHPNMTCAENPCGPHFAVYENDFFTAQFFVPQPAQRQPGDPPTDIIVADDIAFGAGTPCNLGAYEMVVIGGGNTADGFEFEARLALWSNDDRGTPNNPADDRPLAEIPGTARTFTGIPADRLGHRLLVVPTESIVAPDRLWVAIETTPDIGGPALSGFADIGESLDQFAELTASSSAWATGIFFGGFTPETCPGSAPPEGDCRPAGSFRIRAWCQGNPPTGACCDRLAGTCADGVAQRDCNSRWAEGKTCDNPSAFTPACGAHACCFEFVAGIVSCFDLDEAGCAAQNGALKPGSFCNDPDFIGCPDIGCFNQAGDCLTANGSPGCDDPFCCQEVCSAIPDCCVTNWRPACANAAAASCSIPELDDCDSAVAIEGTGLFNFDTTDATQDGPAHDACNSQGGGTDLDKDTWFSWTSTCDGTVFVRTCTHTAVDTMIAAYAGTSCPVSDANLLDCDDEKCGQQSLVTFQAAAGLPYLIRVGVPFGASGGAGQFEITCGPPNNNQCPNLQQGAGDCCSANPPDDDIPGCTTETCCEAVCACDAFCCNNEWDVACAGNGVDDLGCGAAILCQNTCGSNCPSGQATFTSPDTGDVDARMPHEPDDANATLGVTTILAQGPTGASTECWILCETGTPAISNDIESVTEIAGEYTIVLVHPLAPGQVTTITYAGDVTSPNPGIFIAHPANTNGDTIADANDVLALIDDLSGGPALRFADLSRDIDHSGTGTATDILRLIDLLNGAEQFTRWNETAKPSAAPDCQ